MKRMLANFGGEVLSRNELKNISGGGDYKCQAGNLMSTQFTARDSADAQAKCTASNFCQSYGSSGCTPVLQ
ncbi:MAG TPA: hypothetical protein VK175_07755 [Leadbetterella sp.]|nr:hypothetical protein [Leadbetterella sp.]